MRGMVQPIRRTPEQNGRATPAATPAGAVPALSVRGVTKTFAEGKVHALDTIDLTVPKGEFIAVLGPSGCGKSTLLRLIAGLHPCDPGGEIRVFGEVVDKPSPHVGVVFQTYNLLPWLTISANLRLAAEVRRIPKPVIEERARAMLQVLGLTDFAGHHPHQLSGGMRQRVALGQALIVQPDLLLLDEPFGALDALTRDRLNIELLRLCQANNQSVLLVTHSIDEAVLLSDRVLVMSARPGRVVEDCRIDLPRPRDPRETRLLPAYAEYITHFGRLMGVI